MYTKIYDFLAIFYLLNYFEYEKYGTCRTIIIRKEPSGAHQ